MVTCMGFVGIDIVDIGANIATNTNRHFVLVVGILANIDFDIDVGIVG